MDQVLPAGREHAQRGRQLLRQGRAGRAARSTSRCGATAGASLDDLMRALWQRYGRDRHRRARGRHRGARERARRARPRRDFFARYVDGTEDPPLADAARATSASRCTCAPPTGASDRGGKPARRGDAAALHARAFACGADAARCSTCSATARPRAPAVGAATSLVAIDGLKATPERIATLLAPHAPGETRRRARVPPRRADDVRRDARRRRRPTPATSRSTRRRRAGRRGARATRGCAARARYSLTAGLSV